MGNNKKAVISVTALLLAVQFFHNAEDIIAMIKEMRAEDTSK